MGLKLLKNATFTADPDPSIAFSVNGPIFEPALVGTLARDRQCLEFRFDPTKATFARLAVLFAPMTARYPRESGDM
jgi:hypothetical protein